MPGISWITMTPGPRAPPVRRMGDAVVRVRALGPAVREAHARIMPRTGDQNV